METLKKLLVNEELTVCIEQTMYVSKLEVLEKVVQHFLSTNSESTFFIAGERSKNEIVSINLVCTPANKKTISIDLLNEYSDLIKELYRGEIKNESAKEVLTIINDSI